MTEQDILNKLRNGDDVNWGEVSEMDLSDKFMIDYGDKLHWSLIYKRNISEKVLQRNIVYIEKMMIEKYRFAVESKKEMNKLTNYFAIISQLSMYTGDMKYFKYFPKHFLRNFLSDIGIWNLIFTDNKQLQELYTEGFIKSVESYTPELTETIYGFVGDDIFDVLKDRIKTKIINMLSGVDSVDKKLSEEQTNRPKREKEKQESKERIEQQSKLYSLGIIREMEKDKEEIESQESKEMMPLTEEVLLDLEIENELNEL